MSIPRRFRLPGAIVVLALCALPLTAQDRVRDVGNAGPVFGLSTVLDGHLLVADAGAGIVHLGARQNTLLAKLPGVTDVEQSQLFTLLATTGGGTAPTAAKLWRIFLGRAIEVADLGKFEATVNPDGAEINPNPFDVAELPFGAALVADAGANALLIVDRRGNIDWVATLPSEVVSTENIKQLANCPGGPPELCGLPEEMPAQAVSASLAIGPDGYFYVGELKGFPAPAGESKVWRIHPRARHARCGESPDCRVVASGFTSIIDLAFGPRGTLYVVELDEASWFAVEAGVGIPLGGTVNACRRNWPAVNYSCQAVATGLPTPVAVSIGPRGSLHVATHALEPGAAQVVRLAP
jgi:hypothetical protein